MKSIIKLNSKLFAILIFGFVLSGATSAYSQLSSGKLNAIQVTVPSLMIAPDSRAGAMGDVGAATSPDIYSMHWNPSKYAFIKGNGGVGISYIPWLTSLVTDINMSYLAGYKRIDSKQVIGASLVYSSLGDIMWTDEQGNDIRTFKPYEFAIDAAYSRLLSKNFSGGIAFRLIYSNLDGGSSTDSKPGVSFAADISGYYQKDISIFNEKGVFAFGLNLSNIGSKMSYSDSQVSDFIPMNMRLGTTVTISPGSNNKLSLSVDVNKLLVPTPPTYSSATANPDSITAGMNPNVSVPVALYQSFYDAPGGFKEEMQELTYSFGLEYMYKSQFAIRGGYFYENETKGNRKYLTVGTGFRLSIVTIDFSYLIALAQESYLSNTLRLSLAFEFKGNKKADKLKAVTPEKL